MLDKEHYIIWPLYFDKKRSRSEGRRVPLSLAVEKPSVWEIAEAVRSLGLEPIVEENKAHPASWFDLKGRVLVRKDSAPFNKNKLIREIAKKLVEIRSKKKA